MKLKILFGNVFGYVSCQKYLKFAILLLIFFTKLFPIDAGNLSSFVQEIINILEADDSSTGKKIAGLHAFMFLCEKEAFFNVIYDDIITQNLQLIMISISKLFLKLPDFPLPIEIEITTTLSGLIIVATPLFRDKELIDNLLQIIMNYLSLINDSNLYQQLYRLLLQIIKRLYNFLEDSHIIILCQIGLAGLKAQPIFASLTLDFWLAIYKFENTLLDKKKRRVNYFSNLNVFKTHFDMCETLKSQLKNQGNSTNGLPEIVCRDIIPNFIIPLVTTMLEFIQSINISPCTLR